MIKKYGWENFFLATVADWRLCEIPDRQPDFTSYSGSTYWDYGDKVRRWSNHWGPRIASCCWYLDYKTFSLKYSICGECHYDDFRSVHDVNYEANQLFEGPQTNSLNV